MELSTLLKEGMLDATTYGKKLLRFTHERIREKNIFDERKQRNENSSANREDLKYGDWLVSLQFKMNLHVRSLEFNRNLIKHTWRIAKQI